MRRFECRIGSGWGEALRDFHCPCKPSARGDGLQEMKARIVQIQDPNERRRSPRLPVEVEATVRELGTNGVEARVLNISETGFMAESDGRFEVGSRVWLMLPGRERANAIIRWTAGDRLGAEFSEPISVDDPPL
jgi:hypothetical protein